MHRDLKPGNVMLTRAGAKLLDFGLARIDEPVTFSGTVAPTAAAQLTAEGTILSTIQYLSPEQIEGREADARSDIFAFGAVLYEMVTGRKSFEGSSHASLIAAVMSTNPPPVSTIQPMASPTSSIASSGDASPNPGRSIGSEAGDLQSELEWTRETDSKGGGIPAAVVTRNRNRERLAWLVAWPGSGAASRIVDRSLHAKETCGGCGGSLSGTCTGETELPLVGSACRIAGWRTHCFYRLGRRVTR